MKRDSTQLCFCGPAGNKQLWRQLAGVMLKPVGARGGRSRHPAELLPALACRRGNGTPIEVAKNNYAQKTC